jgi:transketolase
MAEAVYQRDVYGQTLIELGKQNDAVVVLDADLSGSTRTALFARQFPGRFFNMGVAEQDMMGVAAGLASCGKTVFASTFAMFAAGRAWDQVRNAIAYNNFDVKIVATHAGISVGPDGASHQALEDIALMRVIPGMKIIVPCDGPQTREAVIAAAAAKGPFYIRLGRAKVPTVVSKGEFVLGKAQVLTQGNDAAIIACGIMVTEALAAAANCAVKGVRCRVINLHSICPIDREAVLGAAAVAKGIVVCEEHSTVGGLAAAVDEIVSESRPAKIVRVGIRRRFGQSGEPEELMKEYHITASDIEKAVMSL